MLAGKWGELGPQTLLAGMQSSSATLEDTFLDS